MAEIHRIILFLVFFYLISYAIGKNCIKHHFNVESIICWLFFTIAVLFTFIRTNKKIIVPLFILFFVTNLSTPLNFCFNTLISYFTGFRKQQFLDMCRKIFIDNTNFIHNLSDLPDKPTIWVANYPTKNIIEYYSQFLLPQKYKMIVDKRSKKTLDKVCDPNRVIGMNMAASSKFKFVKRNIKKIIDSGYHAFLFFDTSVKYDGFKRYMYDLQGIKTGVFHAAKELGLMVTPIVIDHMYISNGYIPKQNFQIFVGESRYINGDEDVQDIIKLYKRRLSKFLLNKFNPSLVC
jgi:hypothetical protein